MAVGVSGLYVGMQAIDRGNRAGTTVGQFAIPAKKTSI